MSVLKRLGLASVAPASAEPVPAKPAPSSLLAQIAPPPRPVDYFDPSDAERFGKAPVGWSKDLDRVIALPRRTASTQSNGFAEKWTATLRRPRAVPCDCVEKFGFCITTLAPIQGWALEEAHRTGGLIAPVGVGFGKTGISLLLAMVIADAKSAVLLVPPNVKPQLLTRDIPQWAAHFKLPNVVDGPPFPLVAGRPALRVIAYSELSNHKATALFDRLKPDLIIADEAHNLRRAFGAQKSSRARRVKRYFDEQENTRFCALSGTMTARSIKDYAHLSAWALGEGSPLPLHQPTVEEWASALDPLPLVAPGGHLKKLCAGGETLRDGFRRRLVQTPGIVATEEGSLGTSLQLLERKPPPMPQPVRDALATVEKWTRPDGEELVEALTKAKCAREVACGFFYRWRWPRGEEIDTIEVWLEARAKWHRELRDKLKFAREHMDSPLLLAKAAIRFFDGYKGPLPVWASEHWQRWVEVRDTAKPETEAVWIPEGEYLARDAAEWAKEAPGIVWYEHDAFGKRVAELSGAPLFGGGTEASTAILGEKGTRSIVASIKAHGTGKNLQAFARNLVANPPSDAAAWEQLIGRTHRQGQKADEVEVHVYRHTDAMADALDTATMRAQYIRDTLGTNQKLLIASRNW